MSNGQIAFMGNQADFVFDIAKELAPMLAELVRVDPPMSKAQCAKWLGCGLTHIDEMIQAGMPHRDYASPGAKIRMLRFWKHEIMAWRGTGSLLSAAELRVNAENQDYFKRRGK